MVSCYFALSMDVADSDDADYRISQMEMGLDGLVALTESKASRSYTYHSIHCRRGDDVALMNGVPVCVSDTEDKAVIGSLKLIEDIEDKESCVIFKGKDKTAEDFRKLKNAIAAEYPFLEVSMIESEQTAYSWMVGVL